MLVVNNVICLFLFSCFESDKPIDTAKGCPSDCTCYSAPKEGITFDGKSVSVICKSDRLTNNILGSLKSFESINTLAIDVTDNIDSHQKVKLSESALTLTHLYMASTSTKFTLDKLTQWVGSFFNFDLKYISLVNLELSNFDWKASLTFNTGLRGIYVSGCELAQLKTENFGMLYQIRIYSVTIEQTPIKSIEKNVFNNWSLLRMLSVTDTDLEDMEWTLVNMPQLWHLNLSRNRIKSIPNNLFSSLPSLKELYLDGNGLKTITWGQVSPGLSRLRVFSFVDNKVCFTKDIVDLYNKYQSVKPLPQFFDLSMFKLLCQKMPDKMTDLEEPDQKWLNQNYDACHLYIDGYGDGQRGPSSPVNEDKCALWNGSKI